MPILRFLFDALSILSQRLEIVDILCNCFRTIIRYFVISWVAVIDMETVTLRRRSNPMDLLPAVYLSIGMPHVCIFRSLIFVYVVKRSSCPCSWRHWKWMWRKHHHEGISDFPDWNIKHALNAAVVGARRCYWSKRCSYQERVRFRKLFWSEHPKYWLSADTNDWVIWGSLLKLPRFE